MAKWAVANKISTNINYNTINCSNINFRSIKILMIAI